MTDICAICHEDLSDNLYSLPECQHTYHTNCIMHWFRTAHNTCPMCQNHGINYNQALHTVTTNPNYLERNLWKDYYRKACLYSKKKGADKEIVNRIKSIKKTEETGKKERKTFREWKKMAPTASTNGDVNKKYSRVRCRIWRNNRILWSRKVAVGYLYFHKCIKNHIIIGEKVQIN